MTAEEREVERQIEAIREGAEVIYGEPELKARIASALRDARPLRVKLGVDPSAPDLHLGHTVVINKLRRFQQLGHVPIFLIGDFTARIGDPSGRKKTRPALEPEQVKANARTYLDQVGRLLDVTRAEIRFNSEWMDPMTTADFIRLCATGTVARLLERDDFSKRYAANEPIAVHEFLYPFVQAYDSVALRADVELGGMDQTFNLLMAREVQRAYGQPPQSVVVHPLLVGTDGHEKMSKSLGNTIGIIDPPKEMFGRIMSIPDAMTRVYERLLVWPETARVLSPSDGDATAPRDPMGAKLDLAEALVAQFHGRDAGRAARETFRREVQEGQAPRDLPEIELQRGDRDAIDVLDVLRDVLGVGSKNEGRRLIAQGGVEIDGARVVDSARRLGAGTYLVRAGKRRFARIRVV
jgi:tyrosyl-tRNA synthetase